MVKRVKIEDEDQEPTQASGNGNASLDNVLQAVANSIQLINDRLDDLDERVQQNASAGAAILQMVNHFYNTDSQHIKELSNISPLSVRPLATASSMDKIGSEELKSGKVSLVELTIDNFLRFRRSAGGRHFALGVPILQAQVEQQAEKVGEEIEGY